MRTMLYLAVSGLLVCGSLSWAADASRSVDGRPPTAAFEAAWHARAELLACHEAMSLDYRLSAARRFAACWEALSEVERQALHRVTLADTVSRWLTSVIRPPRPSR